MSDAIRNTFGGISHRRFTPLVDPLTHWFELLGQSKESQQRTVSEFEEALSKLLGMRHVIAVHSARAGLVLTLRSMGLKPGTQVLLPINTYEGLLPALVNAGYEPFFVDINSDFNMSPEALSCTLESLAAPGVIVATHLYGQPADVPALAKIAERCGVPIVEDCAHTLAVKAEWGMTGSYGRAGIFSLQARKLVNGLSGGAVATNDDELAAKLRQAVEPSQESFWRAGMRLVAFHAEQGLFSRPVLYPFIRRLYAAEAARHEAHLLYQRYARLARGQQTGLSALSAALAKAQLNVLSMRYRRLDEKWKAYDLAVSASNELVPAPRFHDAEHGFYMYVLRSPNAADTARELWRHGVGSLHGPAFMPPLAKNLDAYPMMRSLLPTVVQLPFSSAMSDDDFARVAKVLSDLASKTRNRHEPA